MLKQQQHSTSSCSSGDVYTSCELRSGNSLCQLRLYYNESNGRFIEREMNYSFKSTHFKRSTISSVSLEQKSLARDYPLSAINLQNREMNPFLPLSLFSADWFRNKLGLLTCVTNFSGALGHVRSRDVTQASRGQTANGNTLTPQTSNIYIHLTSHPISFSLSYSDVKPSH